MSAITAFDFTRTDYMPVRKLECWVPGLKAIYEGATVQLPEGPPFTQTPLVCFIFTDEITSKTALKTLHKYRSSVHNPLSGRGYSQQEADQRGALDIALTRDLVLPDGEKFGWSVAAKPYLTIGTPLWSSKEMIARILLVLQKPESPLRDVLLKD